MTYTHEEIFKLHLKSQSNTIPVKLHKTLKKGSVVKINMDTGVTSSPSANDREGRFGILLQGGLKDDILPCSINGVVSALISDSPKAGANLIPTSTDLLISDNKIDGTVEINESVPFYRVLQGLAPYKLKDIVSLTLDQADLQAITLATFFKNHISAKVNFFDPIEEDAVELELDVGDSDAVYTKAHLVVTLAETAGAFTLTFDSKAEDLSTVVTLEVSNTNGSVNTVFPLIVEDGATKALVQGASLEQPLGIVEKI